MHASNLGMVKKMVTQKRFFAIATLVVGSLGLVSCQTESQEPSAADKALSQLQKKYDELVDDKVDDTTQWAADDWENIGDWEYRVENLSFSSPEQLAAQLNEFGDERWELIWLDRTPGGFLVVLKKPSISYLSKIPISQLGKLLIRGSDSEN